MKVESDKVEPSIPCGNSGWGWVELASLHGRHPPAPCLLIASLVPLGVWVWDLLNAFFSLTGNVCCPHRQRPQGWVQVLHCFSFHFPTHPLHGMESPKPTYSNNHKPPPYAVWFPYVSLLATIFWHSGGSLHEWRPLELCSSQHILPWALAKSFVSPYLRTQVFIVRSPGERMLCSRDQSLKLSQDNPTFLALVLNW